jgi:hypothetical protein
MTPTEKAEIVVHRFDLMQSYVEGFGFQDAKECALICVDEILNIVQYNTEKEYAYWQEVKEEINKL